MEHLQCESATRVPAAPRLAGFAVASHLQPG
jgi:hypothetical protein